MVIIRVSLVLMIVGCALCKTSIRTYPTVDLVENTPINTLVISLSRLSNVTSTRRKVVILNLNGFESEMFGIVNENIHTMKWIDREEFLSKQYCLDDLYCRIEVHLLVNDGQEYLIVPIHIVDENDNEPMFRTREIELKFRENVQNGYQIPMEGARDVDEGQNGDTDYVLDCSTADHSYTNALDISNHFNETSRGCLPLFQLIVLSQSPSSSTYDRLALRFHPPPSSSSVHVDNEYKLKVYAIDKKKKKKKRKSVNVEEEEERSVLNLKITIEQKERLVKFSMSRYEFVVLLNSSRSEHSTMKIGRVYALPGNPSDRIYYQIIRRNNNNDQEIEINSLTGELTFIFRPHLFHDDLQMTKKNEIEFDVQASILKRNSSKMLITKSEVKVFVRQWNDLNKISFEYQIDLFKQKQHHIIQVNQSNCFLIDKNIPINDKLFTIIVHSSFYPSDQFILSLHNYLHVFSIVSSLTKNNTNVFILTIRQHLQSTSVYLLNIGVRHKLSQQWLPDLRMELIVVDQWTTSTSVTTTMQNRIITNQSETTTIRTTTNEVRTSSSDEDGFCEEDQIYILYQVTRQKKTKKRRVGLLRVIDSASMVMMVSKNDERMKMIMSMNGSEVIVDGCRMCFDEVNENENEWMNGSLHYELCLSSRSNQCYNITMLNKVMSRKSSDDDDRRRYLSMEVVEVVMLIVSLLFLVITSVLIVVICRLKEMNVCVRMKNWWIYRNRYGLSNVQQQFSASSSRIKGRVQSMVSGESSHSPSCQSIQINNDRFFYHADNYDQPEPLPSTHLFLLSSSLSQSISPSLSSSLIYSLQQQQQQQHQQVSHGEENSQLNDEDVKRAPPRTPSSSSFLQETKQLLDLISTTQQLDSSKLGSQV